MRIIAVCPNPFRRGEETEGPPGSRQVMTKRGSGSSETFHRTVTKPSMFDSEPNLNIRRQLVNRYSNCLRRARCNSQRRTIERDACAA